MATPLNPILQRKQADLAATAAAARAPRFAPGQVAPPLTKPLARPLAPVAPAPVRSNPSPAAAAILQAKARDVAATAAAGRAPALAPGQVAPTGVKPAAPMVRPMAPAMTSMANPALRQQQAQAALRGTAPVAPTLTPDQMNQRFAADKAAGRAVEYAQGPMRSAYMDWSRGGAAPAGIARGPIAPQQLKQLPRKLGLGPKF